jgi:hypothetical protein
VAGQVQQTFSFSMATTMSLILMPPPNATSNHQRWSATSGLKWSAWAVSMSIRDTMEKLGASLARYSGDRDAGRVYIQYHLKSDLDGEPELYIITDAWFDGEPPPNSTFDSDDEF